MAVLLFPAASKGRQGRRSRSSIFPALNVPVQATPIRNRGSVCTGLRKDTSWCWDACFQKCEPRRRQHQRAICSADLAEVAQARMSMPLPRHILQAHSPASLMNQSDPAMSLPTTFCGCGSLLRLKFLYFEILILPHSC